MIFGMDPLVLLQVLRSLEHLATRGARMRLEWRVHSQVRGDVIPLGADGIAPNPVACQAEIVGALASNVVVAQMLVQDFWVVVSLTTVVPLTDDQGEGVVVTSIRVISPGITARRDATMRRSGARRAQ